MIPAGEPACRAESEPKAAGAEDGKSHQEIGFLSLTRGKANRIAVGAFSKAEALQGVL